MPNVNIPTNVLVGTEGLVVDRTLYGSEANRRAKRLIANSSGSRIDMADRRFNEENDGSGRLNFSMQPGDDRREFAIDFTGFTEHLGGNAPNVFVAFKNTLDAFDPSGRFASEARIHSQVFSGKIAKLLDGVIDPEQFKVLPKAERFAREGYFVPNSGKDATNLRYKTKHGPERYTLPGNENQGEDFFISTTAKDTTVWQQLVARIHANPANRLMLMPAKNKLPPSIEDQVLRVTDLATFNQGEAIDFLKRRNGELLEHVRAAGGEQRSDLLAMAVCIMGPQRALITNGPFAVSLYDKRTQNLVTVNPPAVEESRKIVREQLRQNLINTVPIFTGCGDTLIGVFMALEKLAHQGTIDLSPKQILQLAVTISSVHAWNPASNIAYLEPNDIRGIVKDAVTKEAA